MRHPIAPALLAVLVATMTQAPAWAQPPLLSCKTPKHRIAIAQLGPDEYEYRSWNLPKTTADKPDVVLRQKDAMKMEGTGVCADNVYTFTTGNVAYQVIDSVRCTESHPPKGSIAMLSVFVDKEEKAFFWCGR